MQAQQQLPIQIIRTMPNQVTALSTTKTGQFILALDSEYANTADDYTKMTSAIIAVDEKDLFSKYLPDIRPLVTIQGTVYSLMYLESENKVYILSEKWLVPSLSGASVGLLFCLDLNTGVHSLVSQLPTSAQTLIHVTDKIFFASKNVTLDGGKTWTYIKDGGFNYGTDNFGDVYLFKDQKRLSVLRKKDLLQGKIDQKLIFTSQKKLNSPFFNPEGQLFFTLKENGRPFAVSMDEKIKLPLLERQLKTEKALTEFIFIGKNNTFYYKIWEQETPFSPNNRLARYHNGKIHESKGEVLRNNFLGASNNYLFFSRRTWKNQWELTAISRNGE